MVKDDVPEAPAIEGGLNWQVAPVGSPTQDSVTEPPKPNVGLTFTVEVVELPDMTVAGDSAEAESVKLGGVVFKRTATPSVPVCTGKTISGRPPPLNSLTANAGNMPLLSSAGIAWLRKGVHVSQGQQAGAVITKNVEEISDTGAD